ncbi:MAG: hypothetical protein BZ137_02410 [Methanosphaera sp. rholeuAM130]|nr:MAG: hypothetical protein BZ137_02410 [Methanosphaera sp. rholeuAM130]
MHNRYQSFENPEDNKKFYLAIDEENIPNTIGINDFLQENYPSLYQSIKNADKLRDDNDSFFLLKEILYEGKVIGYVSYSLLDEFEENSILLLDGHYLPEDYDYSLIIDDMIETGFWLGFQIIIKYPTRKFIEALIDTEFAYRIDNKLVFSEIAFMTDTVSLDTSLNKVIDEVDLSEISESYTISSLYDLDLCAVVTLTEKPQLVYDNQPLNDENIDDYCSISIALREDEDEFSCITKRRKNKLLKNNKYFVNIYDILTKYEERHK